VISARPAPSRWPPWWDEVPTNDQADRLNAVLRAELVRLGRVTEHGAFLGRDGTFAGVGDLVAARRNGWELTGHAGNQRGPINRETYRVTALGERHPPWRTGSTSGDVFGARGQPHPPKTMFRPPSISPSTSRRSPLRSSSSRAT
jgi:hypothetical protein